MKPLIEAPRGEFSRVRFVLTDMDDTLTFRGRLSATTYAALERLQNAGVAVIVVTAAPAGWCDQMARMWPVSGVIGENGGFYFQRRGDSFDREYWHAESERVKIASRLADVAHTVQRTVPDAVLSDDQGFRQASIAFARPSTVAAARVLIAALRSAGVEATVNSLWVIGWLGGYDKLAMTRRVLKAWFDTDITENADAVLFCGDSLNDASMFGHFRHGVGVSTVVDCAEQLPFRPAWITAGPGGEGFVEVANAVLHARRGG